MQSASLDRKSVSLHCIYFLNMAMRPAISSYARGANKGMDVLSLKSVFLYEAFYITSFTL